MLLVLRLNSAGWHQYSRHLPSSVDCHGLQPVLSHLAMHGELLKPWNRPSLVRWLSVRPGSLVSRSPSARLDPSTVLEVGRVLYPRYFSRGMGLASAHPWPAYAPRDFPRLGFLLLNESREDVLLPTREIPAGLDHASDAIVLGCRRGDYIEARLVLVPDTDVVIQAASLLDPCE